MKKSISFNGIVRIKPDGNIIIDEGSSDYEIETPFKKKNLTFLEGKLVEVKIKCME